MGINQRFLKSLDRTNNNKNYTIPSKELVDKNNFYHQVFGAILTEKSLTPENLKAEFINFFKETSDKNLWPNMYVDVRGSSFRYLSESEQVVVDPKNAVAFSISDPKAETYNPPLIELAFELISLLRVLPLVDFQAQDYFHGISGRAKEYVSFPHQKPLRGYRRVSLALGCSLPKKEK